jgi:hypothetical protein
MATLIKSAMVAADVATQSELDAVASAKLAGDVVQVVHYQTGAFASGTTLIPQDDTIPQNTEGTEVMTLAITPTSATNVLMIEAIVHGSNSVANALVAALFQDATAGALAVSSGPYIATANAFSQISLRHKMTAGTTSATTFKIRIGATTAGTTYFNGNVTRYYGGAFVSSITITEINV